MDTPFIKVIVPLKLDWEPCYRLEAGESAEIGDRVMVPFAGKPYMGVVCAVMAALPVGMKESSVKPIYTVHRELAAIKPSEMAFWRTLAEYYLCSVGEVFKAAYPQLKEAAAKSRRGKEEEFRAVDNSLLNGNERSIADRVLQSLSAGRTVLLDTADCSGTLAILAADALAKGGNVLWMVPEVKKDDAERMKNVFGSALVVWNAELTPAKRRNALRCVRDDSNAHIVFGTRSSVLLPFGSLSLVIVQDEDSPAYKQSATAPRYNGRDAAALLALQKGSQLVLASPSPSLESLYNCLSGKYIHIADECSLPQMTVIDTRAEIRKNGMTGDISRKLLAFGDEHTFYYKPARAVFPKIEDLRTQLAAQTKEDVHCGEDLDKMPADCTSIGFFGLDALLGRSSFRADERAFIELCKAMRRPGIERVAVQTREASHPVLRAIAEGGIISFLGERREFGYPPFTRLVDIKVSDSDSSRAAACIKSLQEKISESLPSVKTMASPDGLRLVLTKDRSLYSNKLILRKLVVEYGISNRCSSRLSFDVDPQ